MMSDYLEMFYQRLRWHRRPPKVPGYYLVRTEDDRILIMEWCSGWNCRLDPITGEIYKLYQRFDVVEWTDLEKRDV